MYRLRAFGGLYVEGSAGSVGGSASQRRALALLLLLASGRDRGISRDRLVGLIWPDSTEERARHVLAQMLYRLRQELGAGAIIGNTTLRLDPAIVAADFVEFESALERREVEAAVRLYVGPFLDGFRLPGVPEFERWAEDERSRLARRHREAVERLAVEAARRGEADGAAEWWRTLAAVDPLDSRVASRLVTALAAAGDLAGALQYARVHETLVRQELDVEPGGDFLGAVEAARRAVRSPPVEAGSLRAEHGRARPAARLQPVLERDEGAGTPPSSSGGNRISQPWSWRPSSGTLRFAVPRRAIRRAGAAGGALLLGLAMLAYLRHERRETDRPMLFAVGHFADYTADDTNGVARTLPGMLATNLGRLEGIAVVSRARLFELAAPRDGEEPRAVELARAAEHAGADELVDGAVYRRPDGTYRLDVRVIDLESGLVRRSVRVEARDAFALVDSATLRVAGAFGAPIPPDLRVVDVTTSSMLAYRLYEAGLRALQQHDLGTARRLFDAALAADSGFAMAAFGAFHVDHTNESLARALRLADRATERERLIIRATWANHVDDPARVAIAETLAVRYPSDPDSHLLLAGALRAHGDFAGALVAARQAFGMDPLSVRTTTPRCLACEALNHTFSAYVYMDSMAAAERVAREWIVRQPSSPAAWSALREVLAARDDSTGALAAYARQRENTAGPSEDFGFVASLAIRTGDFEKAERLLARIAEAGTPHERLRALWWLTICQRHRGRYDDALQTVRRLRDIPGDHSRLLHHAQVLLEADRPNESAALFDSAARAVRSAPWERSGRARHEAWVLTHKASALAAGGHRSMLDALADSIQRLGAQSGYGRDHTLHRHVRGLALAARDRREDAVAELRAAIYSPVGGYTRTNLELARLLVDLGRPQEAIPVLHAALHGGLEASQLYVTHTEIRALLARAFAANGSGYADSAATHRRWVERATRGADPAGRARIARLLGTPAGAVRPEERR